jgi:hypothetical protein
VVSQTSARRCQSEACREPVVWVDHGKPYPAAGVLVLCLEPLKVKCSCGVVSTFENQVVTGKR